MTKTSHDSRSAIINTDTMTVGLLTITDTHETDIVHGQTTGRVEATGTAHRYKLTGPGRLHLHVVDVTWDNGERDIRTVGRHGSPQRFDRLCHGLRLGVMTANASGQFVELRQARMKGPDWSNLFGADLRELDAGANVCTTTTLLAAGADRVGTRAEVLDDSGRNRNYLCATFPTEATAVPIIAYALTRVLPVLNKVAA